MGQRRNGDENYKLKHSKVNDNSTQFLLREKMNSLKKMLTLEKRKLES